MAVAYFMAHNSQNPWPGLNQGDAAILFCFGFLYLVFAGRRPLEPRRTGAGAGLIHHASERGLKPARAIIGRW